MEAATLTFFYRRFQTGFLGAFAGVLLVCFPLILSGQGLIENPPEGRRDGVEILAPDRVHFQLRAPSKDHVHLRGDFNDWFIGDATLMNRSEDGNTWWLEVDGIAPGEWQRFHYLIDDTLEVADPFAPLILDPWNDGYIQASTFPARPSYPSEVASWPVGALRTETPEFQWGDADFQRPAQDRLVIYELLVRDWDDAQTFDAVSQRMDHLAWLGITAIELMPVSEFDGNLSWGYNPGPRFAVDKAYGTEDALKRLVDKAHANGIAVILDIVPNHSFGLDPLVRMYQDEDGGISAGNPWFNEDQIHPYGLGSDFDHGDPWTREFWKRVFDHWLAEFHVDGFRVDLSKGLTQSNTLGDIGAWSAYDQQRVDILFDYANHIWSAYPGTYMILEHLGDNSEETVLANGGFLLWGKSTTEYTQAALGYGGDFSWASWQARGWDWPNLVAYAESHDEQRVAHDLFLYGQSTADYDVKSLDEGLNRLAMMHAFLLALPGPKMMYQWGEFGYDVSIYDCGNGSYEEGCKLNEKPDPWSDLALVPERQHLARSVKALCELKRDAPVFSTYDYNIDFGGMGKRLQLYSPDQNAVLCGNFDVTGFSMSPGFSHTGLWFDALTGDTLEVSDLGAGYFFAPGQWHLWLDTPVTPVSPEDSLLLSSNCLDSEAVNFGEDGVCAYTVTLAVDAYDLMESGVLSPAGLHVAGSFQGWSPGSTSMVDQGEGIWTVSFEANAGTVVDYKFVNGTNWSSGESVPEGCGNGDGFGGYNRQIVVAGPDVFGPHCFGACAACTANLDFPGCTDEDAVNFDSGANLDNGTCAYSVVFGVDVSCVEPAPTMVNLAGSFQGWDAAATPMNETSAGLWTLETTVVGDAEFTYKFLLMSDWQMAENVPESCGLSDGFGGFNRTAIPVALTTELPVACFGECGACDCPGVPLDGTQFCGPNTFWDASLGLCVGLTVCEEDIDGDGAIGVSDVLALLSVFGNVCP